ncbi:MAG TPA: type II toxin-antitoxin system VapB family antitoxin [Gemmatimonadota bacterium]|nr:type II toxin-antitoxin system VapB family antitoxin [Gemmatimonadota bacterium]
MPLNIKNPEADQLARELAEATGETITVTVIRALRERLRRVRGRSRSIPLRDDLRAIRERCAALPVLDPRAPDEILGYDDRGLPH